MCTFFSDIRLQTCSMCPLGRYMGWCGREKNICCPTSGTSEWTVQGEEGTCSAMLLLYPQRHLSHQQHLWPLEITSPFCGSNTLSSLLANIAFEVFQAMLKSCHAWRDLGRVCRDPIGSHTLLTNVLSAPFSPRCLALEGVTCDQLPMFCWWAWNCHSHLSLSHKIFHGRDPVLLYISGSSSRLIPESNSQTFWFHWSRHRDF